MRCAFEERVTLHVCGDFADPEVATHLRSCPDCRALAAELENDAAELRIAPEIPEAAVDVVRNSVLAEVRRRRRPVWVWSGVAAGAVAAALVISLWPSVSPPLPRPPALAVAHVPQPEAAPAQERPLRAHARRAKAPAHHAHHAHQKNPESDWHPLPDAGEGRLVIAKQTADPEVVIILVAGNEGSSTAEGGTDEE